MVALAWSYCHLSGPSETCLVLFHRGYAARMITPETPLPLRLAAKLITMYDYVFGFYDPAFHREQRSGRDYE